MFLFSCKEKPIDSEPLQLKIEEETNLIQQKARSIDIIDNNAEWLEITFENSGIQLDIRYATTKNFTNSKIYDCGKCYLRPEIANKLIQLNRYIEKKYRLRFKVFDCYRPRHAQQKLWDIVPNPMYVTPPEKGSMHNRGMAVDLTLVAQDGKELDMGTEYDYFGREAHTDFFGHSSTINANRALLTDLMTSIGFTTIQSEWWHFSMRSPMHPFSDWEWSCE